MDNVPRIGNHWKGQLPYFPDVLDIAGEGPDVGAPPAPECYPDGTLMIAEAPYGVCRSCLGAMEVYEGEIFCPNCLAFTTVAAAAE